MIRFEAPFLPLPKLGVVARDFGAVYVVNAVVAFLYASTGPVVIVLTVGSRGGLSQTDLASWLFGAFFVNGVISIVLTLLYRQPLVFLFSIAATVLVGQSLSHFRFAEIVGAYVGTGILLFLIGVSGWVRRAMAAVPLPIVMAMVAGVFLRFGVDLVFAFRDGFWTAMPMTVVFLALAAVPRAGKVLPPLVGALIAGVIAIALEGTFKAGPGALVPIAVPSILVPEFSWQAMAELVVPLGVMVLVVQNAQGIAILSGRGHDVPINVATVVCGLASILAGLFGSVSTCLTGAVNAVLSSAGERRRHYTAALFFCLLALLFGLMAPLFSWLLLATPQAFVATLAGLVLVPVLHDAFTDAFRSRYSFSALVCFIITVADVPILRLGAAFWGLVIGTTFFWVFERRNNQAEYM